MSSVKVRVARVFYGLECPRIDGTRPAGMFIPIFATCPPVPLFAILRGLAQMFWCRLIVK